MCRLGDCWEAIIVESDTGAKLPTKITVPRRSGLDLCIKRAKALVDLYVGGA